MTELIRLPLGSGEVALPADLIIKKALEHAFPDRRHQADSGTPDIGQPWPGEGGSNGGLFVGGDRPYYLIVPALPEGLEREAEYGGHSIQTPGADSAWDGLMNTQALLTDSVDHPAAKVCAEYSADGHKDFYLPSRREMAFLEITVPGLFQKKWYWTSTQFSALNAYFMDFEIGWLDYYVKLTTRLVRPVRRKFL